MKTTLVIRTEISFKNDSDMNRYLTQLSQTDPNAYDSFMLSLQEKKPTKQISENPQFNADVKQVFSVIEEVK